MQPYKDSEEDESSKSTTYEGKILDIVKKRPIYADRAWIRKHSDEEWSKASIIIGDVQSWNLATFSIPFLALKIVLSSINSK